MSVGPFQILIILLVLVLLFGRGRISGTMGDLGKGVRAFRQGLSEADHAPAPLAIEGPSPEPAASTQSAADK